MKLSGLFLLAALAIGVNSCGQSGSSDESAVKQTGSTGGYQFYLSSGKPYKFLNKKTGKPQAVYFFFHSLKEKPRALENCNLFKRNVDPSGTCRVFYSHT